jgi:type II secretory pathway pseudopilin PulG
MKRACSLLKTKKGARNLFAKKVPGTFLGSGQDGRAMWAGFSLLEVILSLAILAGALAALGEVMRLGDQNAAAAADKSRAAMLAESVIAEMLVGARPVASVGATSLPLEDDPPWTASIEVVATEYQELVAVRVTIAQQLPAEQEPAQCALVRWMPNPNYVPATQQQSSTSGTNGSTSGSGAGGASSSGSGGGGTL